MVFRVIDFMKSYPRTLRWTTEPQPTVPTTSTLCYRGKTGHKQCEFPPKALPSVHMGSKEGGKIHQVIHQGDVQPEMVELRKWKDERVKRQKEMKRTV